MDEEEEEVIAIPQERHKPASLDKMVTLIASLVEKSRNSSMKLQLSTKDYSAIVGGKVIYESNFYFKNTLITLKSFFNVIEKFFLKFRVFLTFIIKSRTT